MRSGWFEDCKYEFANFGLKSLIEIPKAIFSKFFGLKDSYYKAFEKMIELEKKEGITSTSFFMTKKSHQDGDYELEKTKFLTLLKNYSGHIGLHPGYNTFNNKIEFKNQLDKLSNLSAKNIDCIRQHFLQFDISKTPEIHQQLRIKKDYSLGFAEMYGFRNSIASPFYLFNFETQQSYSTLYYPLFFMDATLTSYLEGKKEELMKDVLTLTEKVLTDFNTSFSILFHNTAFSSKRYKGFTEMYKGFIKITKK